MTAVFAFTVKVNGCDGFVEKSKAARIASGGMA
jgi:hypothetical protein